MEKEYNKRPKVVEILEEGESYAKHILKILNDMPLIKPEIEVLTNRKLELDNIVVSNKSISSVTDCTFIIGSNILQNPTVSSFINQQFKK